MNKKNILSGLMAIILIFTSVSSTVFADNINSLAVEDMYEDENIQIIEYKDGSSSFKYTQEENGKEYLYKEILRDNSVFTQKYYEGDLVEEFTTELDIGVSNEITAEIIRDENSEVIEVSKAEETQTQIRPYAVVPSNRTRHPRDREYYLSTRTNGNVRFNKLTQAAIAAALKITLGEGITGTAILAGIIGKIVSGDMRNIDYVRASYHPYGNDMKGRPLFKRVIKYYSPNYPSRQVGDPVYVDSDLTVVV